MIPMMYEEGNLIDAKHMPLGVSAVDSGMFRYFQRWLLQKAIAVFKWSLPAGWDEDYFRYTLYTTGALAVLYTPQFGVFPQEASLYGYNLYYKPTTAMIANPVIHGTLTRTIDKDCVIFKMTPDYRSIMDIVNYYAGQMALTAAGYSVNMLNSKLAYVFAASGKGIAESFKKAADQVLSGAPYVVADPNLFSEDGSLKGELFAQNLSQNFIAPDILEALNTLSNMFCTDLGLPNANTQKKERMIVDEVNANNAETEARADMWLEGWKESCRKVKAMFGVDISVDWRIKPQQSTPKKEVARK